jgi:hypothetical protein
LKSRHIVRAVAVPSGTMPSVPGPHRRIRGPATKSYRGSRKRLRQIIWSEETPPDFWVLLLLIVVLLAAIAWSLRPMPA